MEQYRPTGFKILPPIVKNILIINGLFFLATITFQTAYKIDLSDIFGMHYFGSEKFRPYQLITYMFMHGGFGHIFFNMFAVWMFGNVLENFWGPKRFLTYYIVTGIGAILIQMLIMYFTITPIQHAIEAYNINPNPDDFKNILTGSFEGYYNPDILDTFLSSFYSYPHDSSLIQQSVDMINNLMDYRMNISTIGASGAVFGILLAFGMMFPNTLIYIYFAIPIKAKWFVVIYGALELYSGIANNPGDNVAHFAHLGGMLFGIFMILYWRKNIKKTFL